MQNKKQVSKTVIITGGSKGIGAAIACYFCEKGDNVLIAARHDNGLAKKLGEHARFQKVDVRNFEDHQALIKTAIKWTGRLDVYINCAGFSEWYPIKEVDEEIWNRMIDTNLKGLFWGCKAAAEKLTKDGCIINISSIAGKRGSTNNSVYCASKFGANGITQSLAKELGPKGIRVNAICPVYVETDGVVEALKSKTSPAEGKDVEAYLKKFANENAALGRLPTADEIAKVCYFLTSYEASAITGQCINVDCGVFTQ